jgi:predicted enzyme related to lactoylglutathione lyase
MAPRVLLSYERPRAYKNVFASVAVRDLDSAVKWYEKLFNRPPSRPMPKVAEWSFERGGSLQVYQLPERAGSGSFTLVVTSVEEHVTQLTKLNIDTSERTLGDRIRTVMITDPDGNHIAFAEPIDSSLAQ